MPQQPFRRHLARFAASHRHDNCIIPIMEDRPHDRATQRHPAPTACHVSRKETRHRRPHRAGEIADPALEVASGAGAQLGRILVDDKGWKGEEMSSVNKVILVGNLGRDPEIRSFQNGGKCATFSIATSEQWKDRNSGERKEKTEWHTIAIFSEGLVSVAEKYLRKGSKVYVEGKLQTRKWQDQMQQDRYSTEIVLQGFDAKLVMLDGPQGGSGRHDYSSHQDEGRFGGGGSAPPAFDGDLNDDHVPF